MSVIIFMLMLCMSSYAHDVTIILDPAGDSKQTGRTIGDTFERAITLNCAQELKRELEESLPSCTVAITRCSGQEVKPLSNASFSNKLSPTLYISIHAFAQPRDTKPSLSLYQFSRGDDFVTKSYDLAFIPVDEAHRAQHEKSSQYAKKMLSNLSSSQYQSIFIAHGLYKLPISPLIGIQAPAFSLELGLIEIQDWKLFIKPLAASIAATLKFS